MGWYGKGGIPGSLFWQDPVTGSHSCPNDLGRGAVSVGFLRSGERQKPERTLRLIFDRDSNLLVVRRVIEIPLLAKRVCKDEDRSDPFGSDAGGVEK